MQHHIQYLQQGALTYCLIIVVCEELTFKIVPFPQFFKSDSEADSSLKINESPDFTYQHSILNSTYVQILLMQFLYH